jgi:hypothetical protein
MLAKLAPHGVLADATTCPDCHGEGEVPNPKRLPIPAVVAAAITQVGGVYGIANADKPEVIRGQFFKSYERIAQELVDQTSARSAEALPAGTTARELAR